MRKFTAILLTVLMMSEMSILSVRAEVNEIIDSQAGVLYSHDASDRSMEKLDRGLVVMSTENGNYMSWRLMVEEDEIYGTSDVNIPFKIYKNGEYLATEIYSTNYTDTEGSANDSYSVAPIVNGVEGERSSAVTAFESGKNYFDIPLDRPTDKLTIETQIGVDENGNELPEDQWYSKIETFEYTVGDTSCGDLDGDGEYELVVKWDCAPHDNSHWGKSGNVLFDAYKLDGTRLWRIDLGENVRAGAHYTQFLVYDFDLDGKAELACKTAPGSKDGVGKYVSEVSSVDEIRKAKDNTTSYVRDDGYIFDGNEYFTAFDGETGAAIDTIYFPIPRYDIASWGDTYGNRCDRHIASVAWLDGQRPYAVCWRGYYMGRNWRQRHGACGISLENGKLNPKYVFDTYNLNTDAYTPGNELYVGQGNHNMTVADVDNDGNDEFISATLCYEVNDADKLVPKWCNFREHGDALHIGNYDPTNEGFEYFTVHEDQDFGMTLMDANTGEEFLHVPAWSDTGRGLMLNNGMGGYYQFNSKAGTYMAYGNNEFKRVNAVLGDNFRIFWDGDLYDEELGGVNIAKWNGAGTDVIFTAEGCISINGTKGNPALQADILGDWREEVIYPVETNDKLRVFVSDIPSEYKIKSLMFDSMYRSGVASEQSAYNQPPHVSMYMDEKILRGEVTDIKIKDEPARKTYIKGQELDTMGLEVEATYENGRVGQTTDFKMTGYDPNTIGEQTVIVSQDGKTAEFKVNVINGTTYYSDSFQDNDASDITIYRQGRTNQSQELDGLNLNVYSRGGGGDGISGYFLGSKHADNFLACFSGGFANAGRGAAITFDKACCIPSFSDMADDEKLIIDFDLYYNGKTSNMQILGITSGQSWGEHDAYLSAQRNSAIPIQEWFNVKIEVDNQGNATIKMINTDGKELYSKSFKTSGNLIEKIVFFTQESQVNIGYLSVTTSTLFKSVKIASLPSNLSYTYGDELNLDGMVVNAEYADGKTKAITNYTVEGYNPQKVGKQTVTVRYLDMADTFEVYVAEDEISYIEIVSLPLTVTYFVGESFEEDGLVLKVNYTNGASKEITEGYEISGFNSSAAGNCDVTVAYDGKQTAFSVKIIRKDCDTYIDEDFESYDNDTDISIRWQPANSLQEQDLGPFKLRLGSGPKADYYTHFAIASDSERENKTFEIATGYYANPGRGPSFTFADNVKIPVFADIDDKKYLVVDFDAYYADTTSNVQLFGLTDSTPSTSNKLVYDQYLSIERNMKIPAGEWINVHAAVNNQKNVLLTITDSNGELIDSRSFQASGDSLERFVFYGGIGTIRLDNLKIYEDIQEKIEVKPPTKTAYILGQDIDLNGMEVFVDYKSGKKIETTSYNISPYNKYECGKQQIEVSYGDFSDTFEIAVHDLVQLRITPPAKTNYIEGQDINRSGLTAIAVCSEGEEIDVTDKCSLTGYNKTKIGSQKITVSYRGKIAEFYVTVNSVTGIEVTPPTKTEYMEGQSLDMAGMTVTALYGDTLSENIASGYSVMGYDKTKPGEQTVTVSYRNHTATFDVKVNEQPVKGIEITKQPIHTEYYMGEELDLSGMEVTATYEDDSTDVILDYEISTYDKTTSGEQTITVTYKGHTATFKVIIKEPQQVTISGITVDDRTYDGASVQCEGEAVVSGGYDGELEYLWRNADGTALDSAPVNAGEYMLIVRTLPTYYEYTGSLEIPFTINKAVATVKADDKTIKRGMAYPEYTVSADGIVNDASVYCTITCEYEQGDECGTYEIVPSDCIVRNGTKDNYDFVYINGTLTVEEPDTVEISGITVPEHTYDGNAVQYSGEAVVSGGYDGELEYIWQTEDGTVLETAPKDAGAYKLLVSVPATCLEYYGVLEIPFEIEKASLTITADNLSIVAGMPVPEYSFKADGLADGDVVKAMVSCDYTTDSEIGDYDIIPYDCEFTVGNRENYDISYVNGTLTAKSAEQVTISGITVDEERTYDGTASNYSGEAVISGGYDGELEYIWQTSSGATLDNAPVNAGEYKLLVRVPLENIEYVGFTEIPFKIKKAPLMITAEDMAITEGEPIPEYMFKANGIIGDDKINVKFLCEYSPESKYGEYKITPAECEFTAGNKNNYEIEYSDGILTVIEKIVYGAFYNEFDKLVMLRSKRDAEADCYVASYDKNGVLVGIIKEHIKLKSDKKEMINATMLKTVPDGCVKVFVWSDMIQPVALDR